MGSTAEQMLLFLAGHTMAQLRELARIHGLGSGYSSLSRSQLMEALLPVMPAEVLKPEQVPAAAQPPAVPAAMQPPAAAPAPTAASAAAAIQPPAAAPPPQTTAAPQPTAALQPPVTVATTPASWVNFVPADPQWATVLWSVDGADQQRASAAGALELCLRVADVTGLPPGDSHPQTLQELVVDAAASNWYMPVPLCDRDYRVELGYRLAAGGWLSLAFSAVARVPAEGAPLPIIDTFVPFRLEALEAPAGVPSPAPGGGGVQHELFYRQATAVGPRRLRLGSEVWFEEGPEGQESTHEAGPHASGAGIWASGRSESGSGLARPRSFWLVADAELIVYGATDPSATLTIGDREVPLQPDGTFRLQVPFPDGAQNYPIRALAADGEQQRWIELAFNRQTPQARVNTREAAELEWFS